MGGLSRKKDYGSKKKPYPSVKKSDFAGGGRSYPIPTKADAIDALRLAGLHGRSDVKAKVYRKYPGLKKHQLGGIVDQYSHGGIVNRKDLGGVMQAVGGLSGPLAVIPGVGTALSIGTAAIGAIGGLISARKQRKEAEEQQRQAELRQKQAAAIQANLNSGAGLQSRPETPMQQLTGMKHGGFMKSKPIVNSMALGGVMSNKYKLNKYPVSYNKFDPNMDLETFDAGGSHEQNPQGGIIIGKDANGVPNTVQQGESMTEFADNKFVFSAEEYLLTDKIPGIPGYLQGKSPAATSANINKAYANRPDTHSQATKREFLGRLARAQEEAKQKLIEKQQINEPKRTDQNQMELAGFPPYSGTFGSNVVGNMMGREPYIGPVKNSLLTSTVNTKPAKLDIRDVNKDLTGLKQDSLKDVQLGNTLKNQTWIERNEKYLDMAAMGLGYGTQLAGVIGAISQRNKMGQPEVASAPTINTNYTPQLINQQQIMRDITDTQKSTIHALNQSSSGDFGQYAANVAAVHSGTAKAIGQASLQAQQMNAAEIARVQQMKMHGEMVNAQAKMQTDEINAANRAAYEQQKAVYNNAIIANIGNLGQSMINYVTAKKFGQSKEQAAIMEALANRNTANV